MAHAAEEAEEAAGTHAGPEEFGAAIEQVMDAEDTGGPKEVQHGGGGVAEEEHAEPAQTPTKGKGPMDVELDTQESEEEHAEPFETPVKGKGPVDVELESPPMPAEALKRKRGRPRKVASEEPSPKVQKKAPMAGEKSVQARLARFFKREPSAEDMEPVKVQATMSKHKAHGLKAKASVENEVVKSH